MTGWAGEFGVGGVCQPQGVLSHPGWQWGDALNPANRSHASGSIQRWSRDSREAR
jgi:hypothetical protein